VKSLGVVDIEFLHRARTSPSSTLRDREHPKPGEVHEALTTCWFSGLLTSPRNEFDIDLRYVTRSFFKWVNVPKARSKNRPGRRCNQVLRTPSAKERPFSMSRIQTVSVISKTRLGGVGARLADLALMNVDISLVTTDSAKDLCEWRLVRHLDTTLDHPSVKFRDQAVFSATPKKLTGSMISPLGPPYESGVPRWPGSLERKDVGNRERTVFIQRLSNPPTQVRAASSRRCDVVPIAPA